QAGRSRVVLHAGVQRPALHDLVVDPQGDGLAAARAARTHRETLGSTAATATGPFEHGDVGAAITLESLGGHDLVVMLAEIHADTGPATEVVGDGDRSTHSLGLPHAPVLVEVAIRARDAGRVGAMCAIHVVGAAIAGHRAHERAAVARWPERAPAVDDVVLDQWIRGPAVQRQVAVAGRIEGSRVIDRVVRARLPALAADPVVDAAPVRGVTATRVHAEIHRSRTVFPEREIVAVVGAGLWRADTRLRVGRRHAESGGTDQCRGRNPAGRGAFHET